MHRFFGFVERSSVKLYIPFIFWYHTDWIIDFLKSHSFWMYCSKFCGVSMVLIHGSLMHKFEKSIFWPTFNLFFARNARQRFSTVSTYKLFSFLAVGNSINWSISISYHGDSLFSLFSVKWHSTSYPKKKNFTLSYQIWGRIFTDCLIADSMGFYILVNFFLRRFFIGNFYCCESKVSKQKA